MFSTLKFFFLLPKLYSLCFKLYDVLTILHKLRSVINVVCEREILSHFTKLFFINDIENIN